MQGSVCRHTHLCGRCNLDYTASLSGTRYTAEKQARHHLGCWAGTISGSTLPNSFGCISLEYKRLHHTTASGSSHDGSLRMHVANAHESVLCWRNVLAKPHVAVAVRPAAFLHTEPVLSILQAVFSACAKMCVRELRKTDTANVSVFYLSLCSTIGATIGLVISMIWGAGQGLMLPHAWEWALFAGIGKGFSEATPKCKQLCRYGSFLSCCHVLHW